MAAATVPLLHFEEDVFKSSNSVYFEPPGLETLDLEGSGNVIKPKEKSKGSKRQDLQGIRGLAILSVLGFHFLPSLFPNGYLGVDQFFVLSGFLMCMLLRRSPSSSPPHSLILHFYSKRLKRILPLYFLMVLCSLFALYLFFPDSTFELNETSAKRALVFMSNRAATQEEDYFSMLSFAIDIFTHTWSLSVEIQFYIIVPFLFLIGSKLVSSRFQVHYYTVLGFLSFLYSNAFCTENEAFNSVIARVWQFMIGMIVYVITDSRNSEKEYKESNAPSKNSALKYFLLFSMIWITGYPMQMSAGFLRPFFTISTGLLMLLSPLDPFLSNPFLTYIGDISYSLYLIHWPLYAYWKLTLSHETIWNPYLALVFVVAVFLAVISFEFYEKWYLKLSDTWLLLICIALFSLSFGILQKQEITEIITPPSNHTRLDGLNTSEPLSYEEASRLNSEWAKYDLKNLGAPSCDYEPGDGPLGWCRHRGLDEEKGKWRMMIFGNSWTANHARIFYEECGGKAKSILQGSTRGCEPLHASSFAKKRCEEAVTTFEDRISKEKPDYGFLLSRFIDIGAPIKTPIEQDPYFLVMKKQLNIFLKSIKYKLYILNAIPEVSRITVPLTAETVKNGGDLVEFDKSIVIRNATFARMRYDKLISECSKCQEIDYTPIFYNEERETWRFYDEKMSGLTYITPTNHFSYHGLELIRPVWTRICGKL